MIDRQSVNPSRLRFTWGASKDAPARWRLGVVCYFRRAKSPVTGNYYVPRTDPGKYPLALIISVRGLLIWLLVLALSTLFGGAAALTKWYQQKPFNRITYSDLALPWHWSRLESLRGQANLAQAEDDMKNGNVRSAFAFLRSGLARYPDDPKARLQLATLYILFRIRPEAEKTLIAAFDHTYPGTDFLKKAVSLIEPGENPAFLITFCERARASLAATELPSPGEARYIDTVKLKALLDLERFEDAVAFVEKNQPKDIALLQTAKVGRALARKDFAEAGRELSLWLAAIPDSEDGLVIATRVYREAGKIPEMQAAILRLRSRYPENPNHIALGVSENLLAGQTQAAIDLLDISVIRFAYKPSVYGEWAESIGKTGHIEVLARLEQLVRETNQNPETVILARMMSAIRIQAWAEAAECSTKLEGSSPPMKPQLRAIHDVAKALLETCTQPVKGAQNTLTASLSGGWFGLYLYRQVIDALAASGRYAAAQEVITLAEGYYPTSRYIATQRTAITAKRAAQEAELARVTAQNAPVTEVGPTFADAAAFLASLDARIRDGQTSEAQRIVRAVRKDAPAWLQATLPELEWREVLLAARVDDLSLLQLNLRTYLRSQTALRVEKILKQANVWHAEKRDEAAVLALREIIKVQPENQPALRLMLEWRPAQLESGGDLSGIAAGTSLNATPVSPALPSSAKELFNRLTEEATAARHEDALRLIRAVRKADPDWLVPALPEIEWREILLAAETEDLSLLQINIRTYLRSRPGALERCLGQARAWREQNKTPAALVAAREILRQNQDEPAAKKMLAEWAIPQP